ncbi:hypothetical protein FT663_00122 [Candidozyma haemuli var. vulneris]|uniref:GPI-anchored wall transfer protein n=1 Tax=Candidozyma haemuli TaxID=45357 RepID=A0A2V1AMM6_9ASCO|nr:hypothetical protein CXQ85_001085 [[Candida] haemuloni]KAF3994152.1 hypothetical protein FT662_00021 [[Candida] haemuloni var. vulneris]KAF3995700.1 hypothetical protein FT663_00122 [[Candida] haemuloni var. vulneris]PVH18796.1 hypothetical protein CXQ85_001085 [[Candida] haemuloni]
MSLKEQKEQFVSNLNGGSIEEVYLVTGVAIAGYVAHAIFKKYLLPGLNWASSGPLLWAIEFFFDELLLLQAITVYSSKVTKIYVNALGLAALIFVYAIVEKGISKPRKQTQPKKSKAATDEFLPRKSFITAYRAHMLVITNLAILAVDFHAFPRRFAKVETWGTSLMDLGVGSFVFSMGLANSRGVIKKKLAVGQKKVSYGKLVIGNTVKALPVLGLGLVRLVSVKSLEYQEHATEYGIHWNFFVTLGLLPVVLGIIDPILNVVPRFFVALAIGSLYEWTLNNTALLSFLLDESNRFESLFAMNKEGLWSFCGYFSIFIFGQSFGSFVLTSRPTPNNLWGSYSKGRGIHLFTVSTTEGLVVMTLITHGLFYIARESFHTGGISRRLANLPYVLWVVSYNAVFLLGYDLVERLTGPLSSTVLDAINANGLATFLLANLLTGLINMTINTLAVNEPTTYAILIGYALVWTSVAVFLHQHKIYIKL